MLTYADAQLSLELHLSREAAQAVREQLHKATAGKEDLASVVKVCRCVSCSRVDIKCAARRLC